MELLSWGGLLSSALALSFCLWLITAPRHWPAGAPRPPLERLDFPLNPASNRWEVCRFMADATTPEALRYQVWLTRHDGARASAELNAAELIDVCQLLGIYGGPAGQAADSCMRIFVFSH